MYKLKCKITHTYAFKHTARACNGPVFIFHILNKECTGCPAACNNSQDNVNCFLNSSSNSEYILLVYDSAAVFNIGRFGM